MKHFSMTDSALRETHQNLASCDVNAGGFDREKETRHGEAEENGASRDGGSDEEAQAKRPGIDEAEGYHEAEDDEGEGWPFQKAYGRLTGARPTMAIPYT